LINAGGDFSREDMTGVSYTHGCKVCVRMGVSVGVIVGIVLVGVRSGVVNCTKLVLLRYA
jgi:hypothetical protein